MRVSVQTALKADGDNLDNHCVTMHADLSSLQRLVTFVCVCSSSATDDHVDPDEQILHLHSNMTVQRQPQVLADSSMWHAAAAMASSASVQKACFDSLKNDPEVYTAMAALFENHGFQLQAIDPTHTGRLALEDGAAEIASHSVTPDPEGSAQPLRALFERVNTVFQNLGDSISDYLARMQRRLHNLVLRLQGAPVATGAKEGESADGASSAPQRDSNLLMDITITMATGLLLVALAGRLGGARMPFAMRR